MTIKSIPLQRIQSTQKKSNKVICWILAGILTLVIVNSLSHAVAKHGSFLASHARKCHQNNNIFQYWQSFERGTRAEICELNMDDICDPNKSWTIRIIRTATDEEITVFKHVGDFKSLEEYMIRQLYIWME